MMDKRDKKELITGIRDFLGDFEEPYNPEEWKHFQRHRKKKQRRPIPLFVKLAGIAASLFLVVYASMKYLPLLEGIDKTKNPMPKQAPKPVGEVERKDSIRIDSVSRGIDRLKPVGNDSAPQIPIPRAIDSVSSGQHPPYSNRIEPTREQLETIPLSGHLTGTVKPPYQKPYRERGIKLPNLRLPDESRIAIRNVRFGVNLNPAFTDKGFAFGGGLSARVALTDRISTEIGVGYSGMTVGNDWEADMSDTVNSQIVGSRNTVGMVSIPVSVNYAFSENFSASLGLVPFRAISDRRTDMLQTNRWMRGDMASGDTTLRLVSERSKSRRPDSLYRGSAYWGFIQLSGHIAPAVLRRYNMEIAPYVGIPVGRLRDDRYRWLHGGVSLRFYFQ